jgi:hypothetical protein
MREVFVIREDERGVVAAQKLAERVPEPLLVADLDRVLKVTRQRLEEVIQATKEGLFTLEVGAIEVGQLQEQRADPVAKEAHHAKESIELFTYTLHHERSITIRTRAVSRMDHSARELRRHAKT